jgi:beta-N-acetylhexosaminidase
MNIEQLVGQVFCCGWGEEGPNAPAGYNEHARYLVEDLQAGGLVLFNRNAGPPEQIAALTGEIRRHAAVPPLIGVDQEGGRVCRLPLPGLIFPGNMALGLMDDPDLTRRVAFAMGDQLAAMGIDLQFAPVLDVNNNPDNPVIGVRSYGDDPELVARHGLAAIEGFRQAGLAPVAKHFPGHGDTSADSHFELPVQPASRDRLDRVELVPFRAALAAGVPAVMSSHILFPELDPDLPSTLSPRILTGLLRQELGFDGLIATDCLEMRGIANYWGPDEAAVRALEAGADLLLVCHTRETQALMHRAVCEAVRAGRLSEERLRASAARIDRIRRMTAGRRASDTAVVSSDAYRELEARVTEAGLALAGPVEPAQPFDRNQPILVSGAARPAELVTDALAARGYRARCLPWSEAAAAELREAPQVVWIALPRLPFPDGDPPAALRRLLTEHRGAVVVAGLEPYCLSRYPESVPRLAAWGMQPPHLAALVRWLSGEIRVNRQWLARDHAVASGK